MASIVLPFRWYQQPQYPISLNKAHPLAQGLVFAFNGNTLRDHANLYALATTGTIIRRYAQGTKSRGPVIGPDISGTQVLDFPNKPSYNTLDAVSIVWGGMFDATTGAYRNLITKSTTNGATATPFDLWLETSNAKIKLARANTQQVVHTLDTTVPTVGVHTTFGIAAQPTMQIAPLAWVNGIPQSVSTTGIGVGAPTSNTNGIRIGRRIDGGTQLDGTCYFAYVYDRQISEGDYYALYENPWQIFKPVQRRIYFDLAGGGQTIAVGQASETDLAQALARIKTKALGQNAETDLAQAVTRGGIPIAVGQVSETDSAQALTARKAKTLGQNSETDLAQPVTQAGALTVAVAQVDESDTAQAITWAPKKRLLGQITDTQSAQTVQPIKSRLLGQVTETDTVQAFAHLKARAIAQVAETNLAQVITHEGAVVIRISKVSFAFSKPSITIQRPSS